MTNLVVNGEAGSLLAGKAPVSGTEEHLPGHVAFVRRGCGTRFASVADAWCTEHPAGCRGRMVEGVRE